MPELTTRNYPKQREMTCGYVEGVDGINTANGPDASGRRWLSV